MALARVLALCSVLVVAAAGAIGCATGTSEELGGAPDTGVELDSGDGGAGDGTIGDGAGDGADDVPTIDSAPDTRDGGADSGDSGYVPGGGPAQAINVAGGQRMTSPGFVLVTTTGVGPGGGALRTSPKYTLKGGTLGATTP